MKEICTNCPAREFCHDGNLLKRLAGEHADALATMATAAYLNPNVIEVADIMLAVFVAGYVTRIKEETPHTELDMDIWGDCFPEKGKDEL